ncbi:MAG: hypothetical protein COS14_13370 [Bacteroidetes bacterium CG02_land_8_20_14_3_00_31_25]|nr:MAG: hypothetical protein COS14_13370 [Bacteroidetes bacterium CG02_land_8_20_14_3_00_31_25]PIX32737.1 MAG: hypothetical protein COZ59_12430 [Bacteroidetes bacterium CG_4_8_14_3_um_filter_31_14]PIY04582.1 MAG: hypothetical protein COZ21_06285 [Bacteroidetes bacterium CG_4_10_14_3_um_filter_31_20]
MLNQKFQIQSSKFQSGLLVALGVWFFELGVWNFKIKAEIYSFFSIIRMFFLLMARSSRG